MVWQTKNGGLVQWLGNSRNFTAQMCGVGPRTV